MSVSSISAGTPRLNQVKNPATDPSTANIKPKDADGDHDGDTSANDAKGLDVKG